MGECVAATFAKKLLGEGEIEAVLRRLDRLTQEEARVTVAQTLEVVYGLMNTVKVVMDGTQALLCRFSANFTILRVDGKASTENIRQALSTYGSTRNVLRWTDWRPKSLCRGCRTKSTG